MHATKTFFVVSSCIILILTSAGKILTLLHNPPILTIRDPALPMFTGGQLLMLSSLVELASVLFVVWARSIDKAVRIVFWLSSMFLIYRLNFALSPDSHRQYCPCLGGTHEWLPISDAVLERILAILFYYLLIGSAGFSFLALMRNRFPLGSRGVKSQTSSVILASLILAGQDAYSVEFSTKGILTTEFYRSGELSSSKTNSFSLSVKECQCWIRINRGNNGILYDEYWASEKEFYNLTMFGGEGITMRYHPETGKTEEIPMSDRGPGANNALLILNSEAVPDFRMSLVTPVWLAFASFCVFSDPAGEESLYPPVFPLGESVTARQMFASELRKARTMWSKNPNSPFLMEKLDVLRDGFLYFGTKFLEKTPIPRALKNDDSLLSAAE